MQRYEYDLIDSTNDEARRLLAAGKIDGMAVVTARGQTAGRGTRGRSWLSPAGAGLYISFVCQNRSENTQRDELPLTTAYTQAAGVACVEAVRAVLNVHLQIKPVNDLMWHGRKVGGILTEAFVEGDRLTALIIGIGMNLHHADRRLPDGVLAASLEEVVSPATLPGNIASELEANIVAQLVNCISPERLSVIENDWTRLLINQHS